MTEFFYGVIEGFYGRQWSWQARADYARFFSEQGFGCYIYAPKGDAYLRKDWDKPWPEEEFTRLLDLSVTYKKAGVRFGLGLSPLGLCEDYSKQQRHLLKARVEQINALKVDTLCILFDDMPGVNPALAQCQLAIVDDILAVSDAPEHIACPTYYSFDPVLEQVFGQMPANYLSDFGAGLPRQLGVFWTGNQVISTAITVADIDRVTALIGRPPVLWDNYPANDGRKTANYLNLRPYAGRSEALKGCLKGHCVNPMNQPELSKLVLMTLADLYGGAGGYDSDRAGALALQSISPEQLRIALSRDMTRFQDQGLAAMDKQQIKTLLDCYNGFDQPAAREVAAWLRGEYRFDPDCLTG